MIIGKVQAGNFCRVMSPDKNSVGQTSSSGRFKGLGAITGKKFSHVLFYLQWVATIPHNHPRPFHSKCETETK